VIVGLVFFPQERFRIPVIDPALIVCAAVACAARVNSPSGPREDNESSSAPRAI
jgi:hypothetical protein